MCVCVISCVSLEPFHDLHRCQAGHQGGDFSSLQFNHPPDRMGSLSVAAACYYR